MRARVIANGTDMGTYEGSDEEEILEVYAEDMGYESYESMLEEIDEDGSDVEVQECAIPQLTAKQLGAILAACGANNEITDAGCVWIESMETGNAPDSRVVSCDKSLVPERIIADAETLYHDGHL